MKDGREILAMHSVNDLGRRKLSLHVGFEIYENVHYAELRKRAF